VRPHGTTIEATLMAPTEESDHELRYVLNEREKIVASQTVTITPAVAKPDARASLSPRQEVTVHFQAPRHAGHWIGFVKRDTHDYLDYADVPLDGDAVALRAG
jgi:Ca-activated chloride channel family protein